MNTTKNKQFNETIQKAAKASGVSCEKASTYLKELIANTTIEEMACALAHFCFRNGPVEDMHAEGKLSDADMKTLNKFCYDKLFTFLYLLKQDELEMFASNIFLFKNAGWDAPEFRLHEPSGLEG